MKAGAGSACSGQPWEAAHSSQATSLVRTGMTWFLASEATLFGTLLALYSFFATRLINWDDGRELWSWTHLYVATVVLLYASASLYMGKRSAERSVWQRRVWLWMGILWAAVFLALKGYGYSQDLEHGLHPGRGPFWQFYYLLTGLHAAHVLAGMALAVWVALGEERRQNVAARWTGLLWYWAFLDLVWLGILALFHWF